MENEQHHFNETCLLVTHYNRSLSLERLLNTFKNLNCSFGEIVVSDDGSKSEHLQKLRQLQKDFLFHLITTPVNKGLGNNINKGQETVTVPFTLYVQEDFEPSPLFPLHLADAITLMKEHPDLDIIKFYAYFKYPYTRPFGKGFSEMVFHAVIIRIYAAAIFLRNSADTRKELKATPANIR
jgi:glycosyltransferase involved in cell wall biosynthesis